jgi:hypothetical protein
LSLIERTVARRRQPCPKIELFETAGLDWIAMGGKPAMRDARQLKAARAARREEFALIIARSGLNILRSKRLILALARSGRHLRRQQ